MSALEVAVDVGLKNGKWSEGGGGGGGGESVSRNGTWRG